MQATLTSTKATRQVTGDLASILRAAIALEADLQPAHGVTVECDDGRTFECANGRVALYAEGEDGEDGIAMMVDDQLMIAWEQGIRTPFADTALQPA